MRDIIFVILLFTGCIDVKKNQNYKALSKEGHELQIEWKDRNISAVLKQLEINELNMFNFLIYFDANCGVCFEKMQVWKDDIIPYFQNDNLIGFHFILNSRDTIVTDYFLKEKIQFPTKWVYFDNEVIPKALPFMVDNEFFNTVFVDENGTILQIGSPLYFKNVKVEIENIIQEGKKNR